MPRVLVLLLLVVLIAGCATVTAADSARLGVMYATAKVIDGDPGKASKILTLAAGVRTGLDAEAMTVAAIDAAVRARIDWQALDIADQLLADALLVELRAQLERRVGTGILERQQRLDVLAVLSWVERAAQMSASR